jgi:exosortase C (VPDSG-CTERM-specific)
MKQPSGRLFCFAGLAVGLCLVFHHALIDLFRLALGSDLYSHILLVPFVSAWFAWHRRAQLTAVLREQADRDAADGELMKRIVAAGVVLLLAGIWVYAGPLHRVQVLNGNDRLALHMFLLVTCLVVIQLLVLGASLCRATLFPLLFLYFMMPIPGPVLSAVNVSLQHATAFVLSGILKVSGTPTFRDGLVFSLPGLTIEVAEECSGIRSTLVLLITALVGGMLFLKSPWRRGLLAASFFPIAALRNAARIATISLLSIHVDPSFFHGPVHRRGGPPFFVLSLVPLFAIMLLLRWGERRRATAASRGGADE